MLSTGIGWMLIDDVPTRVSLMALIVTAPAAMVFTKPVFETAARVGSLLVHSMIRSVTIVPAESSTVAVNCTFCP